MFGPGKTLIGSWIKAVDVIFDAADFRVAGAPGML